MNATRLIGWLCLLAIAAGVRGGEVRVLSRAVVDAGAPVLLADVAALEGDAALALADVRLAGAPEQLKGRDGWARVTLGDVRRALRDAGARPGALALSGGPCALSVRE